MICDVDLEVPDGTRTHTIEVAAGFAAEGLAVELVARGPDPGLEGMRYHRAQGSEERRARRLTDLTLRSSALLVRRRRTARRCYVRHSWSNIPILIVARMLGYRLVTQVDDVQYGRGSQSNASPPADYVKRLAAFLMGRLAHGVVAVSPRIKQLLVEQFRVPRERVVVLSNGVDVDAIRPIPRDQAIRRAGLDPNTRYAVFCGRFASWGDFDTLLEAFAAVNARRPDTALLLVGDGPERERIERRGAELGIGEAMVMTGFVEDRARIADLIGAATVALVCYRDGFAGSPIKLAEYLAAGRAVVAKDTPGMRDALEQTGAGVVVPGEPRAMADAIAGLLDPARADALGEIGRRLAEERYSWRSIVRRTLPLFDADGQRAGAATPHATS
ncbi:MAG TPA: glycosyltransferase family 4 protein [Solirubrobacteraceae bacterium]|jgi:glycosyltransferase involved in cell wall biosynthesis|nr:glycosyltransferase family 4 protein [Solirubrobacteraceae bacterium]